MALVYLGPDHHGNLLCHLHCLLACFSVYPSGNLVGSSHFLRYAHRILARLRIGCSCVSGVTLKDTLARAAVCVGKQTGMTSRRACALVMLSVQCAPREVSFSAPAHPTHSMDILSQASLSYRTHHSTLWLQGAPALCCTSGHNGFPPRSLPK